ATGGAAEDAPQETFLKTQRPLDRAPEPREARPWIYRIATNPCLSELRRRHLRPELRERLPEPADARAENALVDRDLALRIILHLPQKLQIVAWLHWVDGLEHTEVAAVLGISRPTVIHRLHAFRQRARKFGARV